MLYELREFSEILGPLNVFTYITFRTGGAIMTALLFVFLFGPAIIDMLRIKQGKGQPIRDDPISGDDARMVGQQPRSARDGGRRRAPARSGRTGRGRG